MVAKYIVSMHITAELNACGLTCFIFYTIMCLRMMYIHIFCYHAVTYILDVVFIFVSCSYITRNYSICLGNFIF